MMILSIKKNIPSGPYYLVHVAMNCFPSGPEAFTEWLFTPLRPGKSRIPPVFVYIPFLAFSLLASHNFHLAQGSHPFLASLHPLLYIQP
jgi:hypothetical protein